MHEIMTMLEVSEYLRVPIDTLRRWRKFGLGPPSYKLGGFVRYDRSVLLAWHEEQRRAGVR